MLTFDLNGLRSNIIFSIYEGIGKGKHSTVYKGRKKRTINYFAVKSVEKSEKQRVLQEVRLICLAVLACALRFQPNTHKRYGRCTSWTNPTS